MTSWRYVSRVLSRTFDYSGRASRAEFWSWMRLLFRVLLVSSAAWVTIVMLFAQSVPALGMLVFSVLANWVTLFAVVGFLPTLALTVRRLHDTGRGGGLVVAWFVVPLLAWIVFLGIGFVILGLALVGAGPSGVPLYASLGVAVVVTLAVVCWAAWLLSRNGDDGVNIFGEAPPQAWQ